MKKEVIELLLRLAEQADGVNTPVGTRTRSAGASGAAIGGDCRSEGKDVTQTANDKGQQLSKIQKLPRLP